MPHRGRQPASHASAPGGSVPRRRLRGSEGGWVSLSRGEIVDGRRETGVDDGARRGRCKSRRRGGSGRHCDRRWVGSGLGAMEANCRAREPRPPLTLARAGRWASDGARAATGRKRVGGAIRLSGLTGTTRPHTQGTHDHTRKGGLSERVAWMRVRVGLSEGNLRSQA